MEGWQLQRLWQLHPDFERQVRDQLENFFRFFVFENQLFYNGEKINPIPKMCDMLETQTIHSGHR